MLLAYIFFLSLRKTKIEKIFYKQLFMKNTIKLLMCAVVAFCFASCTPENEGDGYRFTLSAKDNSIIATWEAVTGALYYEIQLNENVPVEVKTTAHKFENLDYNNTYSVTLNAIGDAKAVLKSVTKSIKLVRKSTPAYREWISVPATAISNNGRWVVGGYDHQGMMIDLDNDRLTPVVDFELYDVADNGIAVGSYHTNKMDGEAAIYNNGEIIVVDLSNIIQECMMSCFTGITPDGTYAVGWYWSADASGYFGQLYGEIVPIFYDIEKGKVGVPECGERAYGWGAMGAYAVAPDRSILGLDQSAVQLNVIWKSDKTPYEYVDFQYNVEIVQGQEAKIPSFFVGELKNRLSQSGRYVYGEGSTYENGVYTQYPIIHDRTTKETQIIEAGQRIHGMTDGGIVFVDDVPYGYTGTTPYVYDLNNPSEELPAFEEWLMSNYSIDINAFEHNIDTDPENLYVIDGTVIVGASEDGRTLIGITNSNMGWITSVIYLDGVTKK